MGAVGGVDVRVLFILGHRHFCESSPAQTLQTVGSCRYLPFIYHSRIWSHAFLSHCLTGLRCYILGFRQSWRSLLKPPSSVLSPSLIRGAGCRPAAAAAAASVRSHVMPDLCPLGWMFSTQLLSAPHPAPPRSACTAWKLKALRWSPMTTWRKMVLGAKRTKSTS